MNKFMLWRNELEAQRLVEALEKRGFGAHYAKTAAEAAETVMSLIPKGASVGLGGSVTIEELGLLPRLRSPEYQLIDRYAPEADRKTVFSAAFSADVFLTGTNAVTKKGELINVDGTGNRVAAMLYGPDKVIVVTGINKLVDSVEAGFERLKKISPTNAKRVGSSAPCTADGRCHDCAGAARICNLYTVIHNCYRPGKRIEVVVCSEPLGY